MSGFTLALLFALFITTSADPAVSKLTAKDVACKIHKSFCAGICAAVKLPASDCPGRRSCGNENMKTADCGIHRTLSEGFGFGSCAVFDGVCGAVCAAFGGKVVCPPKDKSGYVRCRCATKGVRESELSSDVDCAVKRSFCAGLCRAAEDARCNTTCTDAATYECGIRSNFSTQFAEHDAFDEGETHVQEWTEEEHDWFDAFTGICTATCYVFGATPKITRAKDGNASKCECDGVERVKAELRQKMVYYTVLQKQEEF